MILAFETEHPPYGLTFIDNQLYWTELQSGLIRSLNLTSRNVTVIAKRNSPLYEIKSFDLKFMQEGEYFYYYFI